MKKSASFGKRGMNPRPSSRPAAGYFVTIKRLPEVLRNPERVKLDSLQELADYVRSYNKTSAQNNVVLTYMLDISNQNLQGIDFSYANLEHVDFSNCDLRYADFEGANLSGAVIAQADLTGARISPQQLAQTSGKPAADPEGGIIVKTAANERYFGRKRA